MLVRISNLILKSLYFLTETNASTGANQTCKETIFGENHEANGTAGNKKLENLQQRNRETQNHVQNEKS